MPWLLIYLPLVLDSQKENRSAWFIWILEKTGKFWNFEVEIVRVFKKALKVENDYRYGKFGKILENCDADLEDVVY